MTYFAFEKSNLNNREGSGEAAGSLTDKQCQDLKDGLTQLPFSHAQIMVLHYLQDVSFDDIAKRLGLEPKAVHAMHYEALARLRHSAK